MELVYSTAQLKGLSQFGIIWKHSILNKKILLWQIWFILNVKGSACGIMAHELDCDIAE